MDQTTRAHRLFHLLVVLTLFMALLDWSASQVTAQDVPGTPVDAVGQSTSEQAAPETTDTPVETPTDAADWQMESTATPPTGTPTATLAPNEPIVEVSATTPPTVPVIETSATVVAQIDAPIATIPPMADAKSVSVAGDDTGVLVTVSVEIRTGRGFPASV